MTSEAASDQASGRGRLLARGRRLLARGRGWIARQTRSTTERRLVEELEAFCKEFQCRRPPADWTKAVEELLQAAEAGRKKREFDAAWACFLAAARAEIFGYEPQELWDRRAALRHEADEKLTSWRRRAVMHLVQRSDEHMRSLVEGFVGDKEKGALIARHLMTGGRDETARETIARLLPDGEHAREELTQLLFDVAKRQLEEDRLSLWLAIRIRDEDFQNRYRRLQLLRGS